MVPALQRKTALQTSDSNSPAAGFHEEEDDLIWFLPDSWEMQWDKVYGCVAFWDDMGTRVWDIEDTTAFKAKRNACVQEATPVDLAAFAAVNSSEAIKPCRVSAGVGVEAAKASLFEPMGVVPAQPEAAKASLYGPMGVVPAQPEAAEASLFGPMGVVPAQPEAAEASLFGPAGVVLAQPEAPEPPAAAAVDAASPLPAAGEAAEVDGASAAGSRPGRQPGDWEAEAPKPCACGTAAAPAAAAGPAGGEPVSVEAFLRDVAVRHGFTPEEYLSKRTTGEWERLSIAIAGRLFNTLSRSMSTNCGSGSCAQ